MKDSNYLKEMNARSLWHPMAHPADSLANPPTIVTGAKGVRITDVDGHEVVDGVGGLWNVNLGFSCQPIKDAIAAQLDRLPYYSPGPSTPRAGRIRSRPRCALPVSITRSGARPRGPSS